MGGEFDSVTYEGVHTKAEILRMFKKDVKEALYEYGHRGSFGV